jgi:hypothetical protein
MILIDLMLGDLEFTSAIDKAGLRPERGGARRWHLASLSYTPIQGS